MTRYLSILIQIFPWYLYQIFINRFKPGKSIILPKKLGKLTFYKKLSQKSYPYNIGVYLSPQGRKVAVKIWKGKSKDIYYFNLLHQITIIKILTNVLSRVPRTKTYGFLFPKFIAAIESNDEVALIMEYVKGRQIKNIGNVKDQFNIYSNCVHFLNEVSMRLTQNERKLITTKSALDFIILYPLILLTAVVLNPKLIKPLLKGSYYFVIGLPQLLTQKANTLVHGDLHLENILVTGKNKYCLVDMENMRLCYSIYESISTISLKHNPLGLKKLVLKKYIAPLVKNESELKAFRSLLINNLTHYLSGDKNEAGITSYLKTLDIAFSI